MRRVAVSGIGVVAPNGIGKEAFWRRSAEGRSWVEASAEMAALGTRSTVRARVRGFDIRRFAAGDEALAAEDRFVQYGIAAGVLAVEDARLVPAAEAREAIGCITATAVGGTPTVAATWARLTGRGAHPLRYEPVGLPFAHATCSNYPGAYLMRRYGFEGPCVALSTGCTAGLDTLGLAADMIAAGEADVMLAGASEAPLADIAYATLDVIGSLAVVDCEPHRASRPFDARRGGFVLGEGAAVLVLEDLEHARARGAHVYAEVVGFASAGNAYHMSDLPEDGAPMARVIAAALATAGVRGEAIDYINAHGSSTPQNDLFETNAYKQVFGPAAYEIPISSTKSLIGHSLSAASLMGAAAALGAIEQSIIPPTANLEEPDPKCDLDYVPQVCRRADVRVALVTASGFGGIHSVAVLAKHG